MLLLYICIVSTVAACNTERVKRNRKLRTILIRQIKTIENKTCLMANETVALIGAK